MGSTQTAFRISLVAMAAGVAAALAHVVIDVAGDYLLARDAYDGMAHQSRGLLLAFVGIGASMLLARVLFDALDRRCSSAPSLLRNVRQAIGRPWRFAAETVVLTVVLLAAMECLDCALRGVRIHDVADVFGGSLALGLSAAVFCGALAGAALHRLLRLVADHEPAIAGIVGAVLRTYLAAAQPVSSHRRAAAARPIERGLLLARRHRKRGPPLATPG